MESLVANKRSTTLPKPDFWRGKRVLVTGHTGFKGSWLSLWLKEMGAEVWGIALLQETDPSLFELAHVADGIKSQIGDIRDAASLAQYVSQCQPEIVLHLAAQALVRESYKQPLDTFATNIMGTANLLNALRGVESVKAVVVVTTDKVYRNREWNNPYREDDTLGGHDPYSASKAASELVVASFRDAFLAAQGVAVATARAGNVIGGGDWSADRIIPDAIRAWQSQKPLSVRRPEAIRPWQHVLEPLAAYLVLAERMYIDTSFACPWNFGPLPHQTATVRHVIETARQCLVARADHSSSDYGIVWSTANDGPHETNCLMLETSQARIKLGLVPRWDLRTAITRTMGWYASFAVGEKAAILCANDIHEFTSSHVASPD